MSIISMADEFESAIKAKDFEYNPQYNPNLSVAYHEAGHLYFHLYYDMWFEFVTLERGGTMVGAVHHAGFEHKEESGWFWLEEDEQSQTFWIMSFAGLIAEAKYSTVHNWGTANSDLQEMLYHFPVENPQEIYDDTVNLVEGFWDDIISLAAIVNDNPKKITRDKLLDYPIVQSIKAKGIQPRTPNV
jgi:hypothetical protein